MRESGAWETFEIAGKTCRIFRHGGGGPVFLWACYPHDGRELEQLEEAVKQALPDGAYTVAAYQVSDWNRDLSPWEAPGASAGDRFLGGGRDTLGWILEEYRPWLQKYYAGCEKMYLMGYSLAGLFALWSLYETDCFDGAVCCSGSLWIEGWDSYMSGHRLKTPADVYLSLGGREEKTRNPVMARVGDRTRMQEKLLRRDPKIRRCVLEWNGGGHFADSAGRLAKGVRWMTERSQR